MNIESLTPGLKKKDKIEIILKLVYKKQTPDEDLIFSMNSMAD